MATEAQQTQTERDMNKLQLGMIENHFEEGQYESGINTLDQFRSHRVRPSPAHLRQLIFLALSYTPSPIGGHIDKGKAKDMLPMGSPSKSPSKRSALNSKKRKSKTSFKPSMAACQSAIKLLTAYALTNTPEGLLRAIRCYALSDAELSQLPRPVNFHLMNSTKQGEEEDSAIAQKAIRLKDFEDCWSLLKPNAVPKGGGTWVFSDDGRIEEDVTADSDIDHSDGPVGEYSWSILRWLIDIFEKDQSLAVDPSRGQYSALLLSQIRPAEGTSLRSNVERPLDVVVACYEEGDVGRESLGQRLLALLVNLTSSPLFSPIPFLNSMGTRLSSAPDETVSKILSDLSMSNRGSAFKAAVCDKLLVQGLGLRQTVRRARIAQPKAHNQEGIAAPEAPGSPSKSSAAAQPSHKIYSWPLPTAARVYDILSSFQRSQRTSNSDYIALFHLLLAFGAIVSDTNSDLDGELTWRSGLRNGTFEETVKRIFDTNAPDKTTPESFRSELKNMDCLIAVKCASWKS